MAASQQLDRVIEMMKTRSVGRSETVEDDRVSYEKFTSGFPLVEGTRCERVGVGNVTAEWVTAPGVDENRVMLYLHGGGYLVGSTRTHRATLSRISQASGGRVLGLDYRLAPEFAFPAPVEDAVAAYRWLLSNGADPSKITVAGDSAGGGLTVSAMVALRYLGEHLPAAGICVSAWADLEHTGESMTTNAEVDPSVNRERLSRMAKIFLKGKDPRAPLASPIHADLHGLPPLLMIVGSIEVLLDDSVRLSERARSAGVDATLEVWDDMPHNWHMYAHLLPEGQQAVERIGEFTRKHTE